MTTSAVRRVGVAIVIELLVAAAVITFERATTRAVLWDLGYILNYAYRIAHGELPYRDFPLPHPPGTFLIQAVLVRTAGPSYRSVVVYVVLAALLSFALTFAIVRALVRQWHHATAVAALLVAPIAILGIYSVYPHPFYDPDATLFMLLGIAGVLAVKRLSPTPVVAVPVGTLLVVPMFVKQNVGVAYFVLMHMALLTLLLDRARGARRRWAYLVTGSAAGLALALVSLALTVGVGNYLHWTVAYASERRLASGFPGFEIYRSAAAWIGVAAFLAAVPMLRNRRRAVVAAAALLLAVGPAHLAMEAWVDREFGVLDVWPFGIALSCALGLRRMVDGRPVFEDLLPFVVAGVAHASFLSQGVWGSTYGIWPLIVIAFATVARHLSRYSLSRLRTAAVFPFLLSVAFAWGGAVYLNSDTRLSYAPKPMAPLVESTTERLAGLHERGWVLPRYDAVLAYIEDNIPERDALIALPGADPLWFALDRMPRFPVLLFDGTVNPYTAEELATLVRHRDVRWILVQDGYYDAAPDPAFEAMIDGFTLRGQLDGYRVYAREGVPATAE